MLEIMLRNIEFIISFNSLFILWNQLLPLASENISHPQRLTCQTYCQPVVLWEKVELLRGGT